MSKQTTPGFIHQFEPGSSNRTLLLLHGTVCLLRKRKRSMPICLRSRREDDI
jgi:hypothetical protein